MNEIDSSRTLARRKNLNLLNTSATQSKLFRYRSEQNIKISQQSPFDENNNEKQLIKEIENVKKVILNYRHSLETIYSPTHNPVEHLHELELTISRKDQEIKQINEEIRMLKSAPEEMVTEVMKKFKKERDLQMFKLADEVEVLREELLFLQRKHEKKVKEVVRKRLIMEETQHKYFEVCSILGKTVLSFDEFWMRKEDLRKIKERNRFKKVPKKPLSTHRQKTQGNIHIPPKNSSSSTNLKDASSKMQIAEAALKNFRKKHNAQLLQLHGKLDFLKEENEILQQKYEKKKEELSAAEIRFNESKNKINQRRRKIQRYSEPEM